MYTLPLRYRLSTAWVWESIMNTLSSGFVQDGLLVERYSTLKATFSAMRNIPPNILVLRR